MWTKQGRRPGRTDGMFRNVVLRWIVPCRPRQYVGERRTPDRICTKAKLARLRCGKISFLPGKDGFRAPAHGIPGVMRVSPCGTKG